MAGVVAWVMASSFPASATHPTPFWATNVGSPGDWLVPGHLYVSSIVIDLVPGDSVETVALVGRKQRRGSIAIIGIAVWSDTGDRAVALGGATWSARSGWDFALNRGDFLDLDGDGVLDVGLREAAGGGDWLVQHTVWYRLHEMTLRPVYQLARRVRTHDFEEHRDMAIEGPGLLRERIEHTRFEGRTGLKNDRKNFDVTYRFFPSRWRFAPVSTRVLR